MPPTYNDELWRAAGRAISDAAPVLAAVEDARLVASYALANLTEKNRGVIVAEDQQAASEAALQAVFDVRHSTLPAVVQALAEAANNLSQFAPILDQILGDWTPNSPNDTEVV
jgi:hypothetical protein